MATSTTNKEQTHQQSSTTRSGESGAQRAASDNAVVSTSNDRERPIASGRESGAESTRGRSAVTRHEGAATDPFAVMQRMAEDMDRLFERFGLSRGGFGLTPRIGSSGSFFDDLWSSRGSQMLNAVWTPQVETFRRGDQLVVRADIPGVNKDDVHVEIENDMLTISGERNEEHDEDRDGYRRSERSYGQFYRAIPLPEGVNADKCDASFKDGVLEVTLPAPKQGERAARRIQVK